LLKKHQAISTNENMKAILIATIVIGLTIADGLSQTADCLTTGEQAELLGLRPSKTESAASLPNQNSSSYHITQAKTLLNEMDRLKPDGTRSGNPIFRKVLLHLERARSAGISYEASLNEIYRGSSIAPNLVQLRMASLRENMNIANNLGLLTPENLKRLDRGIAPIVTRGDSKFIGEIVEVDHRIPIGGPKGRLIYENEIANLQVLPKLQNREKSASVDAITKRREAKLDTAYWANNSIAGGVTTVVGLLMLFQETPKEWTAINNLFTASPDERFAALLSVGEHSSFMIMGGGFTVGGLAQTAAGFAREAKTMSRLANIGKWGGRVGWAGFILAEGFAITEYETGNMSERQFYTAQAAVVAGTGGGIIAGTLSGVAVGFCLGWETGPGVVITSIVGGFAGGYAASKTATMLVENYYSSLDENQKKQVRELIYEHYKVTR
jgi:hypothetical protein